MSNEKGHYSLSVATGDSVTLIYSCLGYNKAERILPQVTKDMRLNVQMNYTSLELGEVVATAIRKRTTLEVQMPTASNYSPTLPEEALKVWSLHFTSALTQ